MIEKEEYFAPATTPAKTHADFERSARVRYVIAWHGFFRQNQVDQEQTQLPTFSLRCVVNMIVFSTSSCF